MAIKVSIADMTTDEFNKTLSEEFQKISGMIKDRVMKGSPIKLNADHIPLNVLSALATEIINAEVGTPYGLIYTGAGKNPEILFTLIAPQEAGKVREKIEETGKDEPAVKVDKSRPTLDEVEASATSNVSVHKYLRFKSSRIMVAATNNIVNALELEGYSESDISEIWVAKDAHDTYGKNVACVVGAEYGFVVRSINNNPSVSDGEWSDLDIENPELSEFPEELPQIKLNEDSKDTDKMKDQKLKELKTRAKELGAKKVKNLTADELLAFINDHTSVRVEEKEEVSVKENFTKIGRAHV